MRQCLSKITGHGKIPQPCGCGISECLCKICYLFENFSLLKMPDFMGFFLLFVTCVILAEDSCLLFNSIISTRLTESLLDYSCLCYRDFIYLISQFYLLYFDLMIFLYSNYTHKIIPQ